MEENDSPERVLRDLKAVAAEVGALVVTALPKLEKAAVAVSASDLIAVVRHVRPRLVYVIEERFDAGDQTLDRLDGEDGDRALLDRPRVKALVKAWRKRDGELCLVGASVAYDGVIHAVLVEADWLAEHQAAVEELEDEADFAREEAQDRRDREWKTRLAKEVKALLADSRFTAGRPSAAKRKHLAETLFPRLSSTDINAVVTQAENQLWLTQNQ